MSFGSDLRRFKQHASKAADDTRRAIVVELFNSVILDTPVDTGRARGNWQTSINNPELTVTERLDPSGSHAMQGVQNNLGSGDDSVYLTNNLPYAIPLEFGSSTQSPTGMVRKNVARIRRIIDKAIRENKI
jgi:hypothetical protein